MPQRKVMIIGLDAITLDLVRPWAAEGRLPNLGRFLAEGAAGELQSTLPVMSPAAWSTFATGTNPGKHGVIDFCQLSTDSYEARFVNAGHRKGATFWEIAGQAGIRGGVINVPITYPPRAYNGFLISGVLSPGVNRRMASPPEVFDDLTEASPDYAIDVDVVDIAGRDVRMLFWDRAIETIEARKAAAVGLYRKHRPPLFCVVFMAADRVGHYYWQYMEAVRHGRGGADIDRRLGGVIRQVYEKLDEAVGDLLAEAGDDTDVLILSDHGQGPLRRGLNLRKVLARAGLLAETRPGPLSRLMKRGIEAFAKAAPTSVKSRLKARFAGLTGKAASVVACSGIDFAHSRAYPTGDSAAVFVNLAGRQPGGIVRPGDEYEKVRDEIIACLTELTDPATGDRIAAKAYRREEVWSGACLETLPDVIMEQKEYLYATTLVDAEGDEPFYELAGPDTAGLARTGDHRRNGLLLAMGPHIRHAELAGAQIADVPATVLAMLGCKIPEDFDGKVLTEMLTGDVELPGKTASADRRAGREEEVFSDEDEAAVAERLKGLGYL